MKQKINSSTGSALQPLRHTTTLLRIQALSLFFLNSCSKLFTPLITDITTTTTSGYTLQLFPSPLPFYSCTILVLFFLLLLFYYYCLFLFSTFLLVLSFLSTLLYSPSSSILVSFYFLYRRAPCHCAAFQGSCPELLFFFS